jgi:zinc/manganese transport system substrate-binding protein
MSIVTASRSAPIQEAVVLEPFQYTYVQRGLIELLLLSVGAGLLGTWIVLRGLAFHAHAVGTAAFPGLVLAYGLAFSPFLGALGAALAFTFGVERLARARSGGYGSMTGLALVGALVVGVMLASDVFHSSARVDTLLFGSLLLLGTQDLVIAGCASAAAVIASVVLGRRWLAIGFDQGGARTLGLRSPGWDAALLVLIAVSVISSLAAVGALLATALFVVPAATVRLWTRRLRAWQVLSVILAAVEGTVGLWLSVKANVPPGPAIAVLGGVVFTAAAGARWLRAQASTPRVAAAGSLAAVALIAAGCGGSSDSSAGSALAVTATTPLVADLVRAVGGDAVAANQILQPNSDPHDYEPRPADIDAASRAAVVFESGGGLDAWMDEIVKQAGGDPTVVVLGEDVPVKLAGEKDGHEASAFDPHWWHDPRNVATAVATIRAALSTADPERAASFERNADAYLEQVAALDAGIEACIERIPPDDRKLVTDHDALGYFAHRYGLTVIGAVIPSQTTQAQPSAGETAKLIDLIEEEDVKAVFPESSLNAELAKTIADETGASAAYSIYADTLGPEGSSGSTYLTMAQANADAITRGLTGGKETCPLPGIS